MKIAIGGVVLILAISCIAFFDKGNEWGKAGGNRVRKRCGVDYRAGEDRIRGRH